MQVFGLRTCCWKESLIHHWQFLYHCGYCVFATAKPLGLLRLSLRKLHIKDSMVAAVQSITS
jgi:hypothetical protein